MTKEQKNKSESILSKRGSKKNSVEQKGLGLFDHLKQIRTVQDPNYYKNLTEQDKKSFVPFSLLKGLSMNPDNISTVSYMYRYFDKIPHSSFYKLLIGMTPLENPRDFYPWIKGKKFPISQEIVKLISTYFQISLKEASEYVLILLKKPNGEKIFTEICQDYGMSEKEIKELLKGMNDE
jgi:hypothetical protein